MKPIVEDIIYTDVIREMLGVILYKEIIHELKPTKEYIEEDNSSEDSQN